MTTELLDAELATTLEFDALLEITEELDAELITTLEFDALLE